MGRKPEPSPTIRSSPNPSLKPRAKQKPMKRDRYLAELEFRQNTHIP
jgi:hypothetical protein